MTTQGFAGRLCPLPSRPLGEVARVGLRRFPRHYGNLRWRILLANRGVDPGWDHTDTETESRRDAGWVI